MSSADFFISDIGKSGNSVSLGDSIYLRVDASTWDEANQRIKSLDQYGYGDGWNLVTINSEEENTLIFSEFYDHKGEDSLKDDSPWLGAYESAPIPLKSEGNYAPVIQWASGDENTFNKVAGQWTWNREFYDGTSWQKVASEDENAIFETSDNYYILNDQQNWSPAWPGKYPTFAVAERSKYNVTPTYTDKDSKELQGNFADIDQDGQWDVYLKDSGGRIQIKESDLPSHIKQLSYQTFNGNEIPDINSLMQSEGTVINFNQIITNDFLTWYTMEDTDGKKWGFIADENDTFDSWSYDLISKTDTPASFSGNINGSGSSAEGSRIEGIISASDPDGLDNGDYFAITAPPSNGTATIEAGTGYWSYSPNVGYDGSDEFSITVTDDLGGTTAQEISLNIKAAADEIILVVIA